MWINVVLFFVMKYLFYGVRKILQFLLSSKLNLAKYSLAQRCPPWTVSTAAHVWLLTRIPQVFCMTTPEPTTAPFTWLVCVTCSHQSLSSWSHSHSTGRPEKSSRSCSIKSWGGAAAASVQHLRETGWYSYTAWLCHWPFFCFVLLKWTWIC